jgi:S-adenosylmethionine hydrolase
VDDALTRYGGERVIYEIPEPNDIAPTFHGRDVFAPFIAKCLAGKRVRMQKKEEMLGEPFPSAPQIVAFDYYGNAVTSIPRETKLSAIVVDSAGLTAQAKAYYQEIQENEIAAIQGSHGFWELCCNQASAREAFKLTRGLNLTVRTSL